MTCVLKRCLWLGRKGSGGAGIDACHPGGDGGPEASEMKCMNWR